TVGRSRKCFCGFVSVVVSAGSCNRSFQRRFLPTHSFASAVHASREQLCRVSWQMRIYLVRIPRRKGHSIQSVVLPASTISGAGCCIHGHIRVGPNGRDLKLPQGNSDRTTGPNWFVMSPSCLVRLQKTSPFATIS